MRRKGFKVFLTNGWARRVPRADLMISRQRARARTEAEAMQRQCSLGFGVGSHRLLLIDQGGSYHEGCGQSDELVMNGFGPRKDIKK
jgi:hypothetical protein